jgi:hypothetical protein
MELISAYYVAWITDYVFTWRALPQVWRFVTPFFITGPKFGLSQATSSPTSPLCALLSW